MNFSSRAIINKILVSGIDKLSEPFLLIISETVTKIETITTNSIDWVKLYFDNKNTQ